MTGSDEQPWDLPFAWPFGQAPRFGEPPFECDPVEAQDFCSFPVVVPTRLPHGTAVTKSTVRPEGPEQWSTLRLTIAGGGRSLRLKECHVDWWQPAGTATNLRRVQSISRAGPHVVFWGRDERGRAAAAVTAGRTHVEVRVDRGTFVELELAALFASLRLACPERLSLLAEPPFPVVSYHVRAGRGPRGLDELAAARWTIDVGRLVRQAAVPVLLPDPLPAGWAFDGGAVWPTPPPSQVQWLLRQDGPFGPATVLYARARPLADAQPLKLPPASLLPEGWRVRAEQVRGRRGWIGRQHPQLGGWMAAWAEPALGAAYQLFVRPGALDDDAAFKVLLSSLRPLL